MSAKLTVNQARQTMNLPPLPDGDRVMVPLNVITSAQQVLNRRASMIERIRDGKQSILTTGDIALLFRVSHRAVRCWADSGKLPYFRTLGGHRRFDASAVMELLEEHMP